MRSPTDDRRRRSRFRSFLLVAAVPSVLLPSVLLPAVAAGQAPPPNEEINCCDAIDDDLDGLVDFEDPDCADDHCPCLNPPFGLVFGRSLRQDIGSNSFTITAFNISPLAGFQLGLRWRDENGGVVYEFADTQGDTLFFLENEIDRDEASVRPELGRPFFGGGDLEAIQRGDALSDNDSDLLLIETDFATQSLFIHYLSDPDAGVELIPPSDEIFCAPHTLFVVKLGETGHFRRGDCNSDGGLNLSDAVCIFVGLFRGNQRFGCDKSTDADDSGFVNLTDGIFLLNFLFRAGDGPPTPHLDCGIDPSEDALTCEQYSC